MNDQVTFQNQQFRNPHGVGNKLARLLWLWVWWLLFRPTPPRLMGWWRTFLLRRFGAKLGNAWFHPSVRIWAPWRLAAGNHVFIDRGVFLYNPFGVTIGDHVIVSFDVVLCTASHDVRDPRFGLIGDEIRVAKGVWIAAKAFVMPGVVIGEGAVVGACSVVVEAVAPWTIVVGNAARCVSQRQLRSM